MTKLQFDYFYEPDLNNWLIIPKVLFKDKQIRETLSADSILLYGFLLERIKDSVIENVVDEKNRAYTVYSVEEAMSDLSLSHTTVIKAFRALEKVGLIERKRVGQGRPSLIYVKRLSQGALL